MWYTILVMPKSSGATNRCALRRQLIEAITSRDRETVAQRVKKPEVALLLEAGRDSS